MTKKESCAGVIPLRYIDDVWHILLVKHVRGEYWAFPKGHCEEGESPYQTAERELFEELNLEIDSLQGHPPLKEDYIFTRDGVEVHKHVTYYPAYVKGDLKIKEPNEVLEVKWVKLPDGLHLITFDDTRKMLEPLLQQLDTSR